VYRRAASGERVCSTCLFNAVVDQVKKALNYFAMVRKGSRVLFVVRPDKPLESLIALRVFIKAAKDFDLEIHALCIDGIAPCNEIGSQLQELVKEVHRYRFVGDLPSYMHMVKAVSSICAKVAREIDAETCVEPYTRDELTLFALLGILRVEKEVFSEGLPVKKIDRLKIARPFYYAISHDIAALTYLRRELRDLYADTIPFISFSKSELVVLQGFAKILAGSTELAYSSHKTVELLQSYLIGDSPRCRFCGAFADSDTCRYCRDLIPVLSA